jgi:hypothetical protein
MEKSWRNQTVIFCNKRGLLNRFKFGIKPDQSTTTALLKITDDISMELDRKFITILVLLDICKVFDKLLCQKLLFDGSSTVRLCNLWLFKFPSCHLVCSTTFKIPFLTLILLQSLKNPSYDCLSIRTIITTSWKSLQHCHTILH